MMIMVAHAAGILRRHQDFLPNLTCAADEGRAKFFRPVYFRCRFERAPILAPLVRTVEVTRVRSNNSNVTRGVQRHCKESAHRSHNRTKSP